jgi:hypothetical protein
MKFATPSTTAPRGRDPVAVAALILALVALVSSFTTQAPAERSPAARKGQRGTAQKLANLKTQCPVSGGIKFGTWCLEAALHPIPAKDVGTNDYFYASQTCAREGGWLPTAAQLIGAAPKAALQSTIDDDPATSGAEEFPDPARGIKDKREMSADLFTVTAGSEAAGSEGVTAGSRGNASQGEPDPVPMPANPIPDTLDYVTVYDNHNQGGFAGGEPVGKAENFRCAYAVGAQGKPKAIKGS